MLNIVTINYFLQGEHVVNTDIKGEETLLDADLVIINPSVFEKIWEDYLKKDIEGNLKIDSPQSDAIKSIFESKRKEIEILLQNGKVIVCFVSPIAGFHGERNSKREYSVISNYHFLPTRLHSIIFHLKPGRSSSNSIRIKNPNIFDNFYKAFKDELEYLAYLDYYSEDKNINFLVNKSNFPVGFIIPEDNGIIAFLPNIKSHTDDNKLISVLVESAKKHINKHIVTPPPNWIENFKIKEEEKLNEKIEEFNSKIQNLETQKTELYSQKKEIIKYKALLYEKGLELENSVIEAFKLLEFKAENRKLEDLEHDIVFESPEGRGIAEVEGKDNDAVHISKLDQLNRAVDEDFELTGIYPQGVLVGNHYRFTKPDNRKEPFTDKVQIVAKKKSLGLLTSVELYKAVEYILENPDDKEFKKQCREKILKTEGALIELIK